MVRGALILGLLLLGACSAPQPFKTGQELRGPLGWADYCRRHPGDPSCAVRTALEPPPPSSANPVAGP